MPVGTSASLTCPTVWTVVREKRLVEACQEFTEFTRQDHCPEKDLWMLHKQVTPQDVTDTTKMSQTCGYVGNEKLLHRRLGCSDVASNQLVLCLKPRRCSATLF